VDTHSLYSCGKCLAHTEFDSKTTPENTTSQTTESVPGQSPDTKRHRSPGTTAVVASILKPGGDMGAVTLPTPTTKEVHPDPKRNYVPVTFPNPLAVRNPVQPWSGLAEWCTQLFAQLQSQGWVASRLTGTLRYYSQLERAGSRVSPASISRPIELRRHAPVGAIGYCNLKIQLQSLLQLLLAKIIRGCHG
jgi:hypothetical protein